MDSGEVCEHAAKPALVDIGHSDASGLLGNRLLGLLLGPDEENRPTVGHGLLDEVVSPVDEGQRLLEVDDVDAVALGENVALHLRVPPAGLVPEVDAALEELAHGYDGHAVLLLVPHPWTGAPRLVATDLTRPWSTTEGGSHRA